MRYKSCQWVNRGIEFRTDTVRLCCYGYLQGRENEYMIDLIRNYKGEPIDIEMISEKKKMLKEMHKNGNCLESCKDCIYLFENDWDEEIYFNHFTFNHWTRCNCNCVYCYTSANKAKFNAYEEYPIYPVIKDLFDKGMIKKPEEGCVIFGGGEPTILKDFDKLMNLFLDNGFRNIRVNSSGVKFSPEIEKGLQSGAISLVISPDAGTKKTFELIKQIKCYDTVWENIRKYGAAQCKNNLVKVKYILFPGYNDNYKEIDKWFEEVVKHGIKAVSVSVEQVWFSRNEKIVSKDMYEKLNYIINKAEKLGLDMEVYCEALALIRNYKDKI